MYSRVSSSDEVKAGSEGVEMVGESGDVQLSNNV